MADNAQKTWFATALPASIAAQIEQAFHSRGNALPCSVVSVDGQLVTVNINVSGAQTFPNITIPIATSFYDWLPIKPGDLGVAEGGTIYIGGVSGQGGGVADTVPRGNLSCLVFRPISNKAWVPPGAQNQRVVQGPGGTLIQTTAGAAAATFNLLPDSITMIAAGHTLIINSVGISLDGVIWGTHGHNQGVDSHGDTEQPTTGPVNL